MTTALLKKQDAERSEAVQQEHYWTAEDFYRAAASGEFEDPDRLELIHGRLTRLMQGERHANLRVRVSRRLQRALSPPFFVRDENPLHIALDGEPVPDLMLNHQEEYAGRHPEPEDVALLVEVADSTVEYDTGEKALLYAQAGIADYWVVLAEAQAVLVFRQPMLDGYKEVLRLSGADILSPLVAPEVVWTVDALLTRPSVTP